MNINLTTRDLDLLETLTQRVRLLTLTQATELFRLFDGDTTFNTSSARHRIQQLRRSSWIHMQRINARPMLPVTKPLVSWKPTYAEPNAERIAELTRQRWSPATHVITVCAASEYAAHLFASTAQGLPPREHFDHDLRLAAVYLHYRRNHPRLAEQWIGEHALPKAGYRLKDPDAFLRNAQGKVVRVIESAGRYSAPQIESFHEYCLERSWSYELW